MLHGFPAPTVAFLGARTAAPGDTDACVRSLRAMHALMLAYAGQRRRAAAEPAVAAYWKAAEACTLEKARNIRAQAGFGRLP